MMKHFKRIKKGSRKESSISCYLWRLVLVTVCFIICDATIIPLLIGIKIIEIYPGKKILPCLTGATRSIETCMMVLVTSGL